MLEIIEAAADGDEPVSLEDAKAHLAVEHDADDALIRALVRAARRSIETKTGLALAKERWRETLPSRWTHSLELSRRPVISVETLEYRSSETEPYVDHKTDFRVEYGEVKRAVNVAPYATWDDENAVKVEYTAGMTNVPEDIVAAIKLQLGYLYANRGDVGERDKVVDPEPAIMSLIGPWRRLGI